MAYYTKEAIEEAKKIDALTYLKTFNPSELVQDSRNVYSTKTHDSLKFSNGKWYWFSHGFGGYNALDYLMKVEELSFMDAMNKLVKTDGLILEENPYYNQKDKINRLILPEKNNNNDKIIKYLSSRGIDINIIFDCINNELIYESKENKNVVFVGKDLNNNPRFATIRGSSEKRFMYEASGSDKKYSFRLLSKTSNNTVHVFESAIDLLSYATILKLGNKDYKLENLLSLSGVYQSTGNGKLPISLESYLKKNKQIKRIFLHLDNDLVGRNATESLRKNLENNYEVIDGKSFYGKDWNDYLKYIIEKSNKKKENNITKER